MRNFPKPRNPELHKKLLLEALIKNNGLVGPSCQEVGLNPKTYYQYLKTDPEFKKSVQQINEAVIDWVESKLFEKIREGSEKSIMFFMRHKGRHRGYSETLDISVADFRMKIPGIQLEEDNGTFKFPDELKGLDDSDDSDDSNLLD